MALLFLDRMDGNSVTVLNILEEPEKKPKELSDVVKKLRIIITGLKGSHMNEDGSKVIMKKMCKIYSYFLLSLILHTNCFNIQS